MMLFLAGGLALWLLAVLVVLRVCRAAAKADENEAGRRLVRAGRRGVSVGLVTAAATLPVVPSNVEARTAARCANRNVPFEAAPASARAALECEIERVRALRGLHRLRANHRLVESGTKTRGRHGAAPLLLALLAGRGRRRRSRAPYGLRQEQLLLAPRRGAGVGRPDAEHRRGDRAGVDGEPGASAHPDLLALLGHRRGNGCRDSRTSRSRTASRQRPCSAGATADQPRTHHIVRQAMRASSPSDQRRAYSSSSSSCCGDRQPALELLELREAGQARAHRRRGRSRLARPRADDAHLAAQDAPQLGQRGHAAAGDDPPERAARPSRRSRRTSAT